MVDVGAGGASASEWGWFGQFGHALSQGIAVARAEAWAGGYGGALDDVSQIGMIIGEMASQGPSALQVALRRTFPVHRRAQGCKDT